MLSKGEMLRTFSLPWCIVPIIALCMNAWWASANALAQEAAPTVMKFTAPPTLWSLEGPGSNNAPYLVIGMADHGDTRSSYGSLRIAGDEATNRSASKISLPVGPVASMNRAEKRQSGPLVLSSLFAPTAGVRGQSDFHADGSIRRQTIQGSSDQTGAKGYRLLADGSAPGSFLYGYQTNYRTSKQWSVNSESLTHNVGWAPRAPLFELEFGSWRLPVMLSAAAVSR